MNMHETPMRKKAPSIRLRDDEKWFIATYCIEERLVGADPDGKFTRYRMYLKDIVEEINNSKLIERTINEYHVKDSMGFWRNINELTKIVPKVPIQESVQEEILKIELNKKMQECATQAKRIEMLELLYASTVVKMEDLAKKMQSAFRAEYVVANKKIT